MSGYDPMGEGKAVVGEPDEDRLSTVGDLRALLADLPDDMLVVLSKDAEGNGFSPLDGHGIERYLPETGWSGILLDDEEGETDEADADGNPWEDEDGNTVTAVPCLVLWPTN